MIICDADILEGLFRRIECFKQMDFRCYPKQLQPYIQRTIKQIRPKDLLDTDKYPFPYWVKPSDDNQTFDARVVNSKQLRDYVLRRIPDHNKPIYYSEKLVLISEFRIFVADNKLYCVVDTTQYNRQLREGITDTNHIFSEPDTQYDLPSQVYIDEILAHNPYPYCVIDVAMSIDCIWYLIDVNPPFSVKRHGMPLGKYTEYCSMIWKIYHGYFQEQLKISE